MNKETLFQALSDVGDDLLDMAENKRFVNPWRKWGQMAAVLAVVVCLGALAAPYLSNAGEQGQKAAPSQSLYTAMEETQMLTTDSAANAPDELADEEGFETVGQDSKEEAPAEETAPESIAEPEEEAEAEPELSQNTAGEEQPISVKQQALTKIVCRGTWFYLKPLDEDMGVPPLGEELGTVMQADEPELEGCRVFTVPYSTWFSNYAVDGPVTQDIYVQTPSGYRHGRTYNEKTHSRYTFADVQQAIEEENLQWLADTFVLPIECSGGVQFADPSELSSDELNIMFAASTVMNTGVVVADQWFNEEGVYVVPVSDVIWRLNRFLDVGFVYEPEQTAFYDEARQALICPQELISYEYLQITVRQAELLEGNRLHLLISLPDDEAVKEYIIRFDTTSWRYESVRLLEE